MNVFCSFVLVVIILIVGASAYVGFKIIVGAIRFMGKHPGAQLYDYWYYLYYLSRKTKDNEH